MSLVNLNELIKKAYSNNYAIPAFNFDNYDTLNGVLNAASLLKMPIIVQITQPAIDFLGLDNIVDIIRNESEKRNIDIVLHLDHGEDIDIIKKCIDAGFTSVMIDSSKKDILENIKRVKYVVEYAHKKNVSVEAELGYVSSIKEESKNKYTNLEEVKEFCDKTQVDILGVSIGNIHGGMERRRELDIELLKEINNRLELPLALHGSSGVKYSMLRKAIEHGIVKVNTETAIRKVYKKSLSEQLKDNNEFRARKIMKNVQNSIMEKALEIYSVLNLNMSPVYDKTDFDILDPLKKFEYLKNKKERFLNWKNNSEKYDLREIILFTLFAIDKSIKEYTNSKYSYYIFDDQTIEDLICLMFDNIKKSECIESLIELDEAKLIYRFTLAKKFKISDFKKKQLRINSWGVEWLKENRGKKYQEIFTYIQNKVDVYIHQNQEVYLQLSEELLSDLKDNNINLINKLNEKVVIKLAS